MQDLAGLATDGTVLVGIYDGHNETGLGFGIRRDPKTVGFLFSSGAACGFFLRQTFVSWVASTRPGLPVLPGIECKENQLG